METARERERESCRLLFYDPCFSCECCPRAFCSRNVQVYVQITADHASIDPTRGHVDQVPPTPIHFSRVSSHIAKLYNASLNNIADASALNSASCLPQAVA